MLSKIFNIFKRDLRSNSRDFIALYIIFVPIILGVGLNIFVPSINDTTITVAILENDLEMINHFDEYASIIKVKDYNELKNRVTERDDVIGVYTADAKHKILVEGNENEGFVELTKTLLLYNDMGVVPNESNITFHSYGVQDSPLKKKLVNIGLLLISVLGGMLTGINIVEDKADRTIRAIQVTPLSNLGYILGKSLSALILVVYGTIALVLITGYTSVNFLQLLLVVLVSSSISLVLGLIEGLKNDDVMEAAANIKIIFLPVIAAIVAIEFLAEQWQYFFYWIPFYWTYKGNELVLSNSGEWSTIIFYTVIVFGISALIYAYFIPKIRKNLE